MEALIGCGVVFAVVIILTTYTALARGFVLTKLWGWFIVPFFEVGPLSMPIAIGIGLILGFLTHQEQFTNEDDDKTTPLVGMVISPWITLLIGWIVTLFM